MVEYETTQEAVLEAGELTVDVPVQAVVAGAAGNAAAGYVTTLVNAPTGINYVSNQAAITGERTRRRTRPTASGCWLLTAEAPAGPTPIFTGRSL